LPDMKALAERRGASLLYATNFSIGVQLLFELAKTMTSQLKDAGYHFSISETHHKSKLDAPSGTALNLRDAVLAGLGMEHPAAKDIPIEAHRSGEIAGIHSLIAAAPSDSLTLTHESTSRRPFAEGAVRAAEWLSTRNGVYDFRDVVGQL